MTEFPVRDGQDLMRVHQMGGPWIGQTIYVAAELGLVDLLGAEPVPVGELARQVECNEDALYRFCRLLAAIGVLRAHSDRSFTLTTAGEVLRSDAPTGFRYGVILQSGACFRAWTEVMHTVRTGKPAFDVVHGQSYYDFLDTHPAENELFNRTMGVTSLPPAVAALERYHFGDAGVVVDVGGGIGTLLLSVLRRHPLMRGIVQDLPGVTAEAESYLQAEGYSSRVDVVGASFFDDVVTGDVHILSRVLHNWNDDAATRILRRVRAATPAHGRLVVIDSIIPDNDAFHPSLLADLFMMVNLGGKERTEQDWRELLDNAGFELTRVVQAEREGDTLVHGLVEARPKLSD